MKFNVEKNLQQKNYYCYYNNISNINSQKIAQHWQFALTLFLIVSSLGNPTI